MMLKIKHKSPKIIQSYSSLLSVMKFQWLGQRVSNDMKNDVEKQRSKNFIKTGYSYI